MAHFSISESEGQELPVPSAWRQALKAVADAVVLDSRPKLAEGFVVSAVDEDLQQINEDNISDYPDAVGLLSEKSWETSIHVWEAGYWRVLVDLTTDTGDVSDLVLHAKVMKRGDEYLIEPGLVYVP